MKRGALIALVVIVVILVGLFLLGGFIYLQLSQEALAAPQAAIMQLLAQGWPIRVSRGYGNGGGGGGFRSGGGGGGGGWGRSNGGGWNRGGWR